MTDNSSSKEQLKKTAKDTAASAGDLARDAADTAKAQVNARTEQAKDDIASEMRDTAEALRKAAEEVRDGSPQGSTFSYLANGLADMADSVKDQNVSDIVGVVDNFARRNPLAFLGGAALLGFTVSRFAKASGTAEHSSGYGNSTQSAQPSAHATAYNPNMPQMEFDND